MIDMKSSSVVTVSPKYQVVIPQAVRERLNIKPGSKVAMFEINGQVRLLPVLPPAAYRGIARGMKDTDIPDEPDRF